MNKVIDASFLQELAEQSMRLSPDLVCLHDMDGCYRFVSPVVRELLGYSPHELVGTSPYSLYHPDDAKTVIAASHIESIRGRKHNLAVYRIRRKDGSYTWFETITEPVMGEENGQVKALISFSRDISTRLKERKERTEYEELFKLAFQYSPNGIALISIEGKWLQVNDAFSTMLGYGAGEIQKTDLRELVLPEDFGSDLANAFMILRGEIETYSAEKPFIQKDGQTLWTMLHASLVCGEDKKPLCFIVQVQDISKRKEYEEELLRTYEQQRRMTLEHMAQNQRLDHYFHVTNHNLRSHASNINGLISLLNESSQLEDYREIFSMLKQVTNRLNDSMEKLMESFTADEGHLSREKLRLEQVLERTLEVLQADIIRTDAIIEHNFSLAPAVECPAAVLESIFLNLISNAIKYRHPERRPHIRLFSKPLPSGLELRISDNGMGIDMKQHGDKLFGFRNTFHGNRNAKGLGLYFTKQQIEAVGGTIRAESKPGQGTTFILTFGRQGRTNGHSNGHSHAHSQPEYSPTNGLPEAN